MQIIFMTFSDNKAAAPQFMAAHNDWIAEGLADGVFHCVGSLDAGGGCILAQGEDPDVLKARIARDPFVAEGVVTAEIHGVKVNRTTPELAHLAA